MDQASIRPIPPPEPALVAATSTEATAAAEPVAAAAAVGRPRGSASSPVGIGPWAALRADGAVGWPIKGLFWVALIWVMHEAQALMLPVLIAFVFAVVLATPLRWLRRMGLPDAIGAGVLLLAVGGGAVLLGSMLAVPAAQWWQRAPATIAEAAVQFDRMRAAIPLFPAPPPRQLSTAGAPAAPAADPLRDKLTSEGLALTGAVLGRTLGFSFSAAAAVILLYFMLAGQRRMLARTVHAIGRRRKRIRLLVIVRDAQRDIGRFVGALSLIYLGVGIVTCIALALIGMPNPLLWGSLAGFLCFIPYIGPLMIFTMLLLAGVASFDNPPMMLAPAIIFTAIHAVEANVISPIFVGKRLSLNPVAVFLAVMFFGWMWGVAGAMIAVPMLVALRSAARRDERLAVLFACFGVDDAKPPSLRRLLRRRP